jgi:ppGpp synthetase/RelA/SpoT-type nucleotidyltranferase
MKELSFGNIERANSVFRVARKPIQTRILEFLCGDTRIADPFAAINRMFVRVKSADSILEKITRKRLAVETIKDLQRMVTDVLGMRVITGTLDELDAVDSYLQNSFEIKSRVDLSRKANEYGYHSIDYALIWHTDGGQAVPFEVQLRTAMQHQWSASSFFLFHKKAPEYARPHQEALLCMSESLDKAERCSLRIKRAEPPRKAFAGVCDLEKLPIQNSINLLVINPGEIFVDHIRLGNTEADDERVVTEKLRLYERYPDAAVVECACMNLMSYALNESHVVFVPQYFNRIQW